MEEGGFQIDGHDVGEYKLAKGNSPEALAESVNALLKKEWFPIGSPVPINTTDGAAILQALVRSKYAGKKRISTPMT